MTMGQALHSHIPPANKKALITQPRTFKSAIKFRKVLECKTRPYSCLPLALGFRMGKESVTLTLAA